MNKAEIKGSDSNVYKEARNVIRRNYDVTDDHEIDELYSDISGTIKKESSQESVGYYRALTDPQYKLATIICIILALGNQATGINAINVYSTSIY